MKVVASNRRARYDYDILETVEAGMMLSGPEAKSCRMGHVNLAGAYVSFLGGRPVLKQAAISPYPFAHQGSDYDPKRDRELLLHRKEVERLASLTAEKGVTLIPLEVRAGRYIKVALGVARGRKQVDKRRAIREREVDRKLRRGDEV